MVLGILDENAYIILGSLDSSIKSFSDILDKTNLPKSSLYVTLVKMLGNDLVIKEGVSYKLTSKGVLIYKTFYDVLSGVTAPQANYVPKVVEPKVSALGRFFSEIKKIFNG
jgi:predicted transcriptional regulator